MIVKGKIFMVENELLKFDPLNIFERIYYACWRFCSRTISPWANWRRLKYFYQRKTKGYSDDQTWDIGYDVANYVLPRLKRFKESTNGCPGFFLRGGGENADVEKGMEEWKAVLDCMIRTFELAYEADNNCKLLSIEEEEEIVLGLDLFGKHLFHLWW